MSNMDKLLKQECHRLMRLLFKDDRQAYIWLTEKFGGTDIHFSNIDPVLLRYVHKELLKRAVKKGIYI